MTLRTKTLITLGLTFIALLAVVYLVASMALMRGFARLEDESLRRSMDAAERALDAEKAAVERAAARWEPGEEGVPHEPGAGPRGGAPAEGGADFIALVGPTGAVTVAASRAAEATTAIALGRELADYVAVNPDLVRHAYGESSKSGIVVLPSGAVLVASRPSSSAGGPVEGSRTVIAGRLLDAEAFSRLGTASQTSLSARLWGAGDLPADYAVAAETLRTGDRTVVRPLAGGWVAAYRTVDGFDRRPALILRVDAPRSIFLQGRASLTYLMVSLLLAAIAFASVPLLVVERTVLRRLAWLTGSVASIAAGRSVSARVAVQGNDELADLASRINEMLAALERAQGERGESEARYRAVFEQAGDAIVLFDTADGKVVDANRAAYRLLGFGPGELLDRDILDLVAEDPAAVMAHIEQVQRERRVFGGERTFRRKDGVWVSGEVTSSLLAMRGRDVVCSLVRDTSERRLLEERLRQSQRMEAVGRLASGVAHDFNNLLQSVVSVVGVLRSGGEDAAARGRATATLEAQVASGAALTRQLLLIARQEGFAPTTLDLNVVVSEISEFLRRVVRGNIHFEIDLVPGALPVFGDRARLEQTLINLVANASDAMPVGGHVAIATGRDETTAWFEVRDGGPGMPADVQEHMFDPLFTTREPGQHAGLGLTVVQGIVEEHGGTIGVTSAPGAGTSVRIELPLAPFAELPREVDTPLSALPGAGAGGRILLVEDGEDARKGLVEMLALLGYFVTAVGSGEEAVALAGMDEVDVLLTDYMLPGMNGAELARALLQRLPGLRVIVMSGYAAEDVVRSRVGDAQLRFLAKPFGMEALAREVRAAFGTAT